MTDVSLTEFANSLESLAARIAARADEGGAPDQIFAECVEQERQRLMKEGPEALAGLFSGFGSLGKRVLREGW